MANVITIGTGNIGRELNRQLIAKGHHVLASASSKMVFLGSGRTVPIQRHGDAGQIVEACWPVAREADAVMIAIPNADRGDAELAYMDAFRGKHIITSAKAAHAHRYPDVLALGQPVGRRATVGGGTDMLEVLRRRQLHDADCSIYAVINGTLNYVWSTIQQGGSFAQAIGAAKKLGYAEPSNDDPVDIVNGELLDVAMKATIIYNIALRDGGPYMSAEGFKILQLTSEDIAPLTSRNARHRFIMTFTTIKDRDLVPEGAPGSVVALCGRWLMVGGFYDVKAESPWYDWLRQVDGVNNGFTVHDPMGEDTGYALGGPGAGPEVTAAAMIRDLHDLLAA